MIDKKTATEILSFIEKKKWTEKELGRPLTTAHELCNATLDTIIAKFE